MLPTIDDATRPDALFRPEFGRGFDPDTRPDEGFAAAAPAAEFPRALLVPRSEWQARIEERDRLGLTARARCAEAGVPSKDQGSTNYCWAYSPTYCVEVLRTLMGLPHVALSAASVGGPVTNYRNVGGFGNRALEWISEAGIVPESLWPNRAIDRRYATEAARRRALDYRVTDWIVPRTYDECVSLVLRDLPVSVGYNWWRHQVTWVDLAWRDGQAWPVIRNSWGEGWGESGYSIIEGRRATPDDACAPLVAVAA